MHAPVKSEFITADPEQARELLTAAYAGNRLRVGGSTESFRFQQSRQDLGEVRADLVANPLVTEYAVNPLGCVLACRVLDGEMRLWTGGTERRTGRGDVVLLAPPDRGYSARVEGIRLQIIGLDLPLLRQVDPGPHGDDLLPRLRYEPLMPQWARYWQHTVSYLTGALLGNAEAAASPLVLGNAARLLAATLLTAFASAPASRPADRSDAVPATVRRAVAYLEANPDLDIGVADIARAAHVSMRALQLAFRRHLDTTPTGYLRRVRLDRAHTDLAAAGPGEGTTVTAVAARWGFLDPSRFAARYRTAYGEPPSQTLRR